MMHMKLRKIVTLCFLTLFLTVWNLDSISDYLLPIIEQEPTIEIQPKNEYAKKFKFLAFSSTDEFTPFSKGDITKIFYTIVNNGWKNFTFYCPKEYINCLDDIKEISQDQDLLTHLNNYVHPYNGFKNIQTLISESGKIDVTITYFYNQDEIEQINQKVEEIYNAIITYDMDDITRIRIIHDYIINNTRYNRENEEVYKSYIAYGPLIYGYATCNGYTDAMALFLEKMGIPNFKVAKTYDDPNKEGHVWNAVYINDSWHHLDLTWDDPVTSDGSDYLQDKYFLISTDQLLQNDLMENNGSDHQFKTNIYLEFKQN